MALHNTRAQLHTCSKWLIVSVRVNIRVTEGDTQGVATLNFGAKYGSFEQLETAIKRYEEVNYVTFFCCLS